MCLCSKAGVEDYVTFAEQSPLYFQYQGVHSKINKDDLSIGAVNVCQRVKIIIYIGSKTTFELFYKQKVLIFL